MKFVIHGAFILCIILALFISTGCEDEYKCEGNYLEIDVPNLLKTDGYYRLTFLEGYNQTFTTLRAQTGSEDNYQKLAWAANKEVLLNGIWTNVVNTASYTNEEGIAYTVLSVWEESAGDTITIYCGYDNECEVHFIDLINVIIE